jgi:hypothetical protein
VDPANDRVVLDRKRQLPVEEHLDTAAASSARHRGRAARAGERRPRLGPGNAVTCEPLPLLEGDDGEAGFLAGDSIDCAQGEEAEVGEPLLKRARVGVRLSAGVGRRFRRRHDRPSRLRPSHGP